MFFFFFTHASPFTFICIEFHLLFYYLSLYRKVVLQFITVLSKLVLSANFLTSLLTPFSRSFMNMHF